MRPDPIHRRLLLGAMTLAASLAIAAPAVVAQEADPLRIVTSFSIDSMNPWEDGFWMQEFGQAELLMKFEADGEHHPWLLETLENPEPTRWVMTLRDGLSFQNGKPVDAEAVLASINASLANSAATRSTVREGAVFTVTGPLEITVTSETPWPELPGVLADEQVFLIHDAEAVAAAGDNWASLVGAGIYTGPYAVTALDPAGMEAEAYAGYWQGTPALPGVEVRFVPDANARILAVQNDEADLALYPPLAARAMVDGTEGLHFTFGVSSPGGYLGYMNLAQGPLADVALRRAVMLAIDYRELAEDVFRGSVETATSLYGANVPWALQNYRTDTDEAARLLDDAGWVAGADGMRARDGTRLSLILAIYPQQPDLVPLSTAIQAQLARVGIAAEVTSFDGINDALMTPSNRWDLAFLSNGTTSFGRVGGFFDSYVLPGARRNFGPYDNAEVNALVAKLESEMDPESRYASLRRIQEILWDEDPYVFATTISRGRVVTNDRYACYEPGFALYHVSWQTAPCE